MPQPVPIHRAPSHHVPMPVPQFRPPHLGNSVNNLSPTQMAAFLDGLDQFTEVDSAATGLGPIFNNVSCAACHSAGAVGGASAIFVTRYGKTVNGIFDPLASEGGSLLHSMAINPRLQEVIPSDANTVARRLTTPLFGAGLIEAIPDSSIMNNALRVKRDGVRGRASLVTDVASGLTRAGRFGWKAQHATLLSFAGDAYQNEVGVTNRLFPHENAPNGNVELLAQFIDINDPFDDQPDPDTRRSDIDRLSDYMAMLAPPPPVPLTRTGMVGEAVFNRVGCAECHQKVMITGPSSIQAVNMKPAVLWSDLLLHNMGSLNDGIAQGNTGANEMRTSPLWGLRFHKPYLHDGRAANVDASIRGHDGEGTPSRNRYQTLTAADRAALLEFLNSL